MRKWLSEPLLHFLILGVLLFALFEWGNESPDTDQKKIVISAAHIDRLVSIWQKRWSRVPTEAELEGLIAQQIREEVLYREALALGLDQHDPVVRRRLAQKVEFITDDIADQADPGEEELQEFLQANRERFLTPGKISFEQVYFNLDTHGANALELADQTMNGLNEGKLDPGQKNLGDRFMFGNRYEDLPEHEVTRLFGEQFTQELFKMSVGDWQGPVYSGYGIHLVRVESISASSLPGYEDVSDKVRAAWLTEQRQKLNDAFYQGLKQQYQVIVEPYTPSDTL